MGLADFKPATKTVKAGGSSFTVRGLSLLDIEVLVTTYYGEMEHLVVLYGQVANDVLAMRNAQAFILELVRKAPALAADVLVLASGEADQEGIHDVARSLPFPVQTAALQAIMDLTFNDVGGPKNFLATLGSLAGGMLPPGAAKLLERSQAKAAESNTSSPSSGGT